MLYNEAISNASKAEKEVLALEMSNYSYNLLTENKIKAGLYYAQLATKASPEVKIAFTNLALGYLLNNQWDDAKNVYLKYKDSTYISDGEERSFRQSFLEDLIDMEKKGITHPDFGKVRQLLNEKD